MPLTNYAVKPASDGTYVLRPRDGFTPPDNTDADVDTASSSSMYYATSSVNFGGQSPVLASFYLLLQKAQAAALQGDAAQFSNIPGGYAFKYTAGAFLLGVSDKTDRPFTDESAAGVLVVLPGENSLNDFAQGTLARWAPFITTLNIEVGVAMRRYTEFILGLAAGLNDDDDESDPGASIEQFELANNVKLADMVKAYGGIRAFNTVMQRAFPEGQRNTQAAEDAMLLTRLYVDTYVPELTITDLIGESAQASGVANKRPAKELFNFVMKAMPDLYVANVGRPVSLWKRNGKYDGSRAWKLPMHLVTQAGKALFRKLKITGTPYFKVYNPETRKAVCKMLIAQAEKDSTANKFDALMPKKYQKANQKD